MAATCFPILHNSKFFVSPYIIGQYCQQLSVYAQFFVAILLNLLTVHQIKVGI